MDKQSLFRVFLIFVLAILYTNSIIQAESSSLHLTNEQQIKLPETPSGRCAAAYFKAFNSGSDDQMRAFLQKFRTKSYLKRHPMKKRIEFYNFLLEACEALMPVRFVNVSDYEIIVFARTKTRQDLVKTRFKIDSREPHNLLVFTITPGVSEEALQLTTIDDQIIGSTIDSLAGILRESYVDPEKGKMMADRLIHYKSSGRYNEITDGTVLALRLTEDLWPLCRDEHLRITYGKISEEDNTSRPESDKSDNYGYRKIEILENNIGYIRFDEFHHSDEAKEVAAKALETVADCDALIFDLRYNSGGSPELVLFIYSYLFDKPTYVGSRYSRIHKDTQGYNLLGYRDFWTLTDIPGKPFGAHVPVYILTSSNTFSAAEEFSYCLKDLKRAIVVGETTAGGAHPVMHISVNEYFGVRIPYARMISPVSKTDWEGTGVIPDIQVPASKALDAACKEAAKRINAR